VLVRSLRSCRRFTAGDGTALRELFHPAKEKLALRYSLAHAVVKPKITSLPHRLKTSEVYYIIAGKGRMQIDGESRPVKPGDAVYIPPKAVQCITNTGTTPLEFICIVDPAWRKQDEEILSADRRVR
jgi:mannose-6-phosphate isomerase-like protein (cupin superfamily)